MPQTVLVTGATGKQGSATVSQLCKLPNSSTNLRILAVTRNPSSESSRKLKEKHPQIELVRGSYDDISGLFDSLPATPDAVFSVQPSIYRGYTPEIEIAQGKGLHEAAVDVGVKHIVYTSVDRHGPDSDTTLTGVPHFDCKWEIEKHLISECDSGGGRGKGTGKTTWTILRPTTFMDNITADMMGRVVAATLGRCSRPHQLIAAADIGWFAAQALTQPDKYAGRKISLAGDEIGLEGMRERFYERMGYPFPESYWWMGSAMLYMVKELGVMYQWFDRVGYAADIAALRKEHPGLLKFGDWVEKESGFTRGGEVMSGWLS